MQQKKRRRGMLGTLLLTAILVTAVFAYTNTISGLNAPAVAADASVVDGFAASNINWVSAAGKTVDGVSFDLAPTPSVVRVSLDSGATWQNCTAGATVTCNFAGGVDAHTIVSLDVYAQE
jgi:hypothetical protein